MTGGIVVVGGGLGAARVAAALRTRGYDGAVTIVGGESHLPYDRPPLSKAVVRGEIDDTTLHPPEFYRDNKIDLRLGVAVTSLNVGAKTISLADGSELDYDSLVVATGLTPRSLPDLNGVQGVHTLRSVDDARAVRAAALSARAVVVVGAGFVGCELAASFRSMGLRVTLVEPASTTLAAALGQRVGALVERLHHDAGVDVRTSVGFTAVTGGHRVDGVVLDDGSTIAADLVVLGIGSIPVIDWLAAGEVHTDNGIVTDASGRTSAPDVWALGDVAHWDPGPGRHRVEHWSNVAVQVAALVPALLGDTPSDVAAPVPYFWSDQYGLKIQALGDTSGECTVHIRHDDGRKFLAHYEREGSLVAVVGAGMASKVMTMRSAIAARTPVVDLS